MSPTASTEWTATCENDHYIMWIIPNFENALPRQAMQNAMILYMFARDKEVARSSQSQNPPTLPDRALLRILSANNNRQRQSDL